MAYAYVTLVTSDSYVPGALVLNASIRAHGSSLDTVVLVTPETLSASAISILQSHFTRVAAVGVIRSSAADSPNLRLLGRPELDVTLTKVHAFDPAAVGDYARVCFLDADALLLANIDDVFAYLDPTDSQANVVFAAAPDIGWPDCFNSGVFVTAPSASLFAQIRAFVDSAGTFDGGDQGLLNSFFHSYSPTPHPRPAPNSYRTARLPFIYNTTPVSTYSYLPAYQHFKHLIRVVHFIGEGKPWKFDRFNDGSAVPRYVSFVLSFALSPLLSLLCSLLDQYIESVSIDCNHSLPQISAICPRLKLRWPRGLVSSSAPRTCIWTCIWTCIFNSSTCTPISAPLLSVYLYLQLPHSNS